MTAREKQDLRLGIDDALGELWGSGGPPLDRRWVRESVNDRHVCRSGCGADIRAHFQYLALCVK